MIGQECQCCGFHDGRHWYRCQHWKPAQPQKYRWLTVGLTYCYGPRAGKGNDTRRGTLCQVVTVPRPGVIGNVLVRWPDGYQAVVPAGVLRKVAA